jgi:antitoxin PrlF
MATATVTSKGQITIPKEVRDTLLINAGDRLEFILIDKKEALIRPVSKKVDEVFGRLFEKQRRTVSVDQMNEAIQKKTKEFF